MMNLDYLAAKYGQQLGLGTLVPESRFSTALNILHEQGIYAMFLWLHNEKDASDIGVSLQGLFSDADSPVPLSAAAPIWEEANDVDKNMASCRDTFTQTLATMFIAKELISLTLTYARHAAKTRPNNTGPGE